jgi:hypothetical protein
MTIPHDGGRHRAARPDYRRAIRFYVQPGLIGIAAALVCWAFSLGVVATALIAVLGGIVWGVLVLLYDETSGPRLRRIATHIWLAKGIYARMAIGRLRR